MKIIVVSPHRDDAAFSLSLSISALLAGSHHIVVVNCFTQSNYAPLGRRPVNNQAIEWQEVAAERAREDERWAKQMMETRASTGSLSFQDLRLWDAPFRLSCSEGDVCDLPVNPEDQSLDQIRSAVKDLQGDILIVPMALGNHVDHLTARNAFRFGGWFERIDAFYEDLPYATRDGVTENIEFTAHAIDSELSAAYVREALTPDLARELKLNWTLCYSSQIDLDVAERMARFSQRYQGRERLWSNPNRKVWPLLFERPEAGAHNS